MDATTIRAWAAEAARALAVARVPIDRLNVFPVPDGDTGTNLALTVAEGAERLSTCGTDHGDAVPAAEIAADFARGALLGARGNSGVIVSQYLRGFAEGLAEAGAAGLGSCGPPCAGAHPGALVAVALERAERAARAAVAQPVEGTILTAATAAATAARAASDAAAPADVVAWAAVTGAREALARTPQTLDVLRVAGVVDAGASGLVVLLEALATTLGGDAPPERPGGSSAGTDGAPGVPAAEPIDPRGPAATAPVPGPPVVPPPAVHVADDAEFEVMYVVEPRRARPADARTHTGYELADHDLAPLLSRRLQAIGTSVAVVGGADGWHVHVHTDQPAAAVAAGEVGVRSQVVVRRLVPQGAGPHALGVVVGTGAPGLIADLARSGAVVLVLTGWPVTARVLRRAVVDAGADRVVVLPGSPSALAAARTAARTADDDAARAPARAAPGRAPVRVDVLEATDDLGVAVALAAGSLSGMAGVDGLPAAPAGPTPVSPEARVTAMRDVLARVRTATVDRADVASVLAAARRLLDDDAELVTVLSGAEMSRLMTADALQRALSDGLAGSDPEVEVVVLPGGQREPVVALAAE